MKKYPISDEKRGAAANVSYLKLSFDGKIAGKCSFGAFLDSGPNFGPHKAFIAMFIKVEMYN